MSPSPIPSLAALRQAVLETLEQRRLLEALTSGLTVTGSLDNPGEADDYTFYVQSGDAICVCLGEVTATLEPQVTLLAPNGSVLATDYGTTGALLDHVAAVSGTYTVRVNDQGGTDTGQYMLTAFTPRGTQDPDGDAGAVVNAQTVAASLTPGDLDVFTFNAVNGEGICVSMTETSSVLEPELLLFGPGGTQLHTHWGTVGARVDFTATASGTYYVVARNHLGDSVGNYGITVFHASGTPSADGDAGPVISGKTVSANLAAGDIDVFTFTASAGQGVLVQMTETASVLDPDLAVYGPGGGQLASHWGYVGAHVELTAPDTGTYYVAARTRYADGTGAYGLTVFVAGGSQDADGDAGPISTAVTRTANLSAGDLDVFTLPVNAGEDLLVSVTETATSLEPEVFIYAPDGSLAASKYDSIGVALAHTAGSSGTHFVVVRTRDASTTGSYGITAVRSLGPQAPDGDAGRIYAGQTKSAYVSPGDIDVFSFAAHTGDEITFTVAESADSLEPQAYLYGPDGGRISSDWDSTAFTLTYNVPVGGTYRLAIRDEGGQDTGNYTVKLDVTAVQPSWFGALHDNLLSVNTTNNPDTIALSIVSGALRLRVNGKNETYHLAETQRIEIQSLAGNDLVDWTAISINTYINAGDGDDTVSAGGGRDTLTGGAGRNRLLGGFGDDRLNGSGGRDLLYGEGNDDRLYGNGGNDFLDGGGNVDRLFGGDGDDALTGGSGNDKLYGELGNDVMEGGKNDDLLVGGDGDDVLYGNPGIDTLRGDEGNDAIYARDSVIDLIDGGDGTDTGQLDVADNRVSIEVLI
jgi:Ca2+-binding RTX toxin-like protein